MESRGLDPQYSYKAILSATRTMLIRMIEKGGYFDENILLSFSQSYELDKHLYRIEDSDPLLIQHTKILINLLYQIEQILPLAQEGIALLEQQQGKTVTVLRILAHPNALKESASLLTKLNDFKFYWEQLQGYWPALATTD